MHKLVNLSDQKWIYKQEKSKSESSNFGRKMTKSGALTKENSIQHRKNMFFTQIEAFWASLKKNLVVKFFKSGLWPPGNRRNLSIHDFFFWKKKNWITQKWIFEIFAFFRSNFLEKRVFPGPLVYKNHSIPSWLSYFALTSQPEWPKGKI